MSKRDILKGILTGEYSSRAEARRALGIETSCTLIDTGHPSLVDLHTDGQDPAPVPRAGLNLVFDRFDNVYQIEILNACPPITDENAIPENI